MRHYHREAFRNLDDGQRHRDYELLADDTWTGANERDQSELGAGEAAFARAFAEGRPLPGTAGSGEDVSSSDLDVDGADRRSGETGEATARRMPELPPLIGPMSRMLGVVDQVKTFLRDAVRAFRTRAATRSG